MCSLVNTISEHALRTELIISWTTFAFKIRMINAKIIRQIMLNNFVTMILTSLVLHLVSMTVVKVSVSPLINVHRHYTGIIPFDIQSLKFICSAGIIVVLVYLTKSRRKFSICSWFKVKLEFIFWYLSILIIKRLFS